GCNLAPIQLDRVERGNRNRHILKLVYPALRGDLYLAELYRLTISITHTFGCFLCRRIVDAIRQRVARQTHDEYARRDEPRQLVRIISTLIRQIIPHTFTSPFDSNCGNALIVRTPSVKRYNQP